ncbi:MAG: hypothetical protein RMK65_03925 [Anaerolineae bacterium]|nr:hypothetical protein [Anaerolineae bacterium]MCX8066985.1 hypothetical protein [Anaerolineae bacterium]MDW7991288.1 hypothetical protein [Anaerolineae bacterium]
MSLLRDIALIVLALQGVFVALVLVAVLAAVNYGLYRAQWWRRFPRFLARVYGILLLVRERVDAGARAAATPVFFVSEKVAALRGALGLRRVSAAANIQRGGQR